jgi:hypothetical protein
LLLLLLLIGVLVLVLLVVVQLVWLVEDEESAWRVSGGRTRRGDKLEELEYEEEIIAVVSGAVVE